MESTGQGRLSPAMVVAALALVVALAGTALAGPDALTRALTKQEKKVTKKLAKKQAKKQIRKKAPKLSVGNAANLGHVPAAEYVRRGELAPIPVTQLALNPGWQNATEIVPSADLAPASAYRDQLGVVHLEGLILRTSGSNEIALDLPGEFAPPVTRELTAVCDGPSGGLDPSPGVIFVYPSGNIEALNGSDFDCAEQLSLEGISFRAAG